MNKTKQRRWAAFLILLDQISKGMAVKWLEPIGTLPVLPFFSLTYVENTGISFGLMQWAGNRLLLVINIALVSGIIWYYLRHQHWNRWYSYAFLLIISGALGNITDRILRGFVVDFLDFHVWPVFNLADSMISIGAGLYILGMIKDGKNQTA